LDGLLPKNPCKAKSVKLPTATKKKIIPWSLERVRAVVAGLPKRFQAGGKLAFGCGLRQGEVFGFAVEDIDFKGGWIHVNRQVRLVGTKPVFALPKGNKIRSVPLPAQLAAALKAHMKEFPPVAVAVARPRAKPDGEPKTVRLLFVDEKSRAYNRSVFNMGAWEARPGRRRRDPTPRTRREVPPGGPARRHARPPARPARLRLRAPGREGEHQGALRVPRPLGPGLHVADVHAPAAVQRDPHPQGDRRRLHGNGSRGGRRRRPARRPGHISAPSETNVPSMCPGRLTALMRT
jgi:hypothetical protein